MKKERYYKSEETDIISAYIGSLKLVNRSENTIETYAAPLKQFREFLIRMHGELPNKELYRKVDEITLEDFISEMRMNDMAISTINTRLSALRGFYKFLYKRKYVDNFEKDIICLYRSIKMEETSPVFMTVSEALLFLEASKRVSHYSLRDYTISKLLLYMGLRVSELCKLNVSNIGLEEKILYVDVSKGHKSRMISIPDDLLKTLDEYIKYRNTLNIEGNHLFFSMRKTRMTTNGVRDLIERIRVEAGIDKEITPHKLRHTCASLLRYKGVPVDQIREILGHKKLDMVMRYAHIYDTKMTDAINSNPLIDFEEKDAD